MLVALFAACLLAVVTANPVVQTSCGSITGVSDTTRGVDAFIGIRYGTAQRWRAPTATCFSGNATTYGNKCPQLFVFDGSFIGEEDCLFLNVWTNNIGAATANLQPVMFFIHGGSLMTGSGAEEELGSVPYRFARDANMVSVSINYRLNVFGFLALSALSQNDPRGVSGNYGFLDQILALQWVRDNIQAFGGDPQRVTIWGQSSGGTSVLSLISSPLASGLFQRAISMSGSPKIDTPLGVAENIHMADYVSNTPCTGQTGSALYTCLNSQTAQTLVQSQTPAWNPAWLAGLPSPNDVVSPLPVIDGVVLPHNISYALATRGAANDVPLILGVMQEESDIAPVDIVTGMNRNTYVSFIKQKFSVYGHDFGEEVLDVYPLASHQSYQQHYDSISSDIGDGCGNIGLAGSASTTFSHNVYMYIGTQAPQNPECFFDYPLYCSQFAFHTWDMDCLLDNDDVWSLTPQDKAFGTTILSAFQQFAANGTIHSSMWAPFNSAGYGNRNNAPYYVTDLSTNGKLWRNAKKEQCRFWHENGFDWRMWQN